MPPTQQEWFDAVFDRLGPGAASAISRFTTQTNDLVRRFVARGVSDALTYSCTRPIIGALYLRLLIVAKIKPEPPTPEFVDGLIARAIETAREHPSK